MSAIVDAAMELPVGDSAACRGNLPGPSRRIVVEPIEIPAEPDHVPAQPAGEPEDEPAPAR
jgi:hypothetical protein